MERMNIIIEGPECHECLLAVRRFLSGFEGIEDVEMTGGSFTVTYDPQTMRADEIRIIACETLCLFGFSSAVAAV